MTPNLKPSQRLALLGVIDPDAYAAGTVTTDWIPAATCERFLALISAGDLGASATLDAKLQQASSAAGAGAKDITGKVITQMTQAGSDSNKQAMINLRADELDVAGGFTHFRLSVTVAVATSDAGASVFGMDERYGPANLRNIAAVSQIVG